MAMVNMNNLLNGKDSRWLQLEVCREFQRNKCSRPDTECKFAHPPANVEVQNGRVTACYDSIKGRCNREKPPCKYFHPPQHLKDQLLINGRNHLALKNALMQQMGLAPGQPLVPGQVPAAAVAGGGPFLGIPAQVAAGAGSFSPFYSTASGPAGLLPVLPPDPSGVGASQLTVVGHQGVGAPQKMPRSDRLEVCREYQRGACKRPESECRFAHPPAVVSSGEDGTTTELLGVDHETGTVVVCMDAVKGRCTRTPCRYFHPPLHLHAYIKASNSASTSNTPPNNNNQLLLAAAAAAAAAAASNNNAAAAAGTSPGSLVTMAHHQAAAAAAAAAAAHRMDVKSVGGSFYYDNFAFPGMVPYKRAATDKSGVPVYQPGATTYQQLMTLQQQPYVPVTLLPPAPPAHASATGIMVMGAAAEPDGAAPAAPSNAHSVVYTDADGQLLDTLPVCQDFSRHHCKRPACKFVHLIESHVEVLDNRVTVCRDAARGRCSRALCKYYHLPVELPPAPQMARLHSLNNNICSTTQSVTSTAAASNTSPIHTSSASSSINQDKNTTWPVDNMPQYIH